MIPLSSLVTVTRAQGPDIVERFNVFTASKIVGDPAPGYSSGHAIAAMEEVAADTLGDGYQLAWTGAAYQEQATGGTAQIAFIFGLIMLFLILAAQYERWSLPLAVITAVPFAVFGAALAVLLRGLQNDLYFQVGLIGGMLAATLLAPLFIPLFYTLIEGFSSRLSRRKSEPKGAMKHA